MKIHVTHPGVKFSLSDVFDGLCWGLRENGVTVTDQDPDAVILVNGNFHTVESIVERRQQCPVYVLCTESPYDCEQEIERVAVADGAWTHERAIVPAYRAVNERVNYLPHAWFPERHGPAGDDDEVPSHDVVFVGAGFSERMDWINRIDWSGIDLGLYGLWTDFGLSERLEHCVRKEITPNEYAAALYRKAKINLNIYRTKTGSRKVIPRPDVYAESLNPRAYELAACGAFHISTPRMEIDEKFGPLVPIVTTWQECEAAIREWLPKEDERIWMGAQLRACVVHDTWRERAGQVLADLRAWVGVTV